MNQLKREDRLYLDHASTSWPKAVGVVEAMTRFMIDCGASASRGNYAAARRAQQIVDRVRSRLAETISAEQSSCITFHAGCTAALNVAIHGLVRPLDHAVVAAVEHNSVLRPATAATRNVTIVPCDASGRMNAAEMTAAITPDTRIIALTHASNVTGIVQPVAELVRRVAAINDTRPADRRIFVLCDAAQTFGYLPIDVRELGVDGLAAPAHKGSGGPTGIACLYLRPDWHSQITPSLQGGSGYDGMSDEMPTSMPGRLEPGTMNVAAIAGWEAALNTLDTSTGHLAELATDLRDGLARINGIRMIGQCGELPIASIDFGPMLPPSDAAAILDQEFSIDVRAGYHCAARLHEFLHSQSHGTLRISCGHTTQPRDLIRLFQALQEIAESLPT